MKEKNHKVHLEEELYAPIREYLQVQGYEVKGEVEHCDVTAIKGDEVLVVEMKMNLNLDVILQAALRQRIADVVYIAVPKKSRAIRTKRWKNICYLLRRLSIGLLLISVTGKTITVEEALEPEPLNMKMSKGSSNKKKGFMLKEFHGRHGDYNTGGCTRKKLVTAYREMAIHIAALLKFHGPLSIKQLKGMGTDEKKTGRILQNNHYKWFDRVSKGVYSLNERGIKELDSYTQLVEYYIDSVNDLE